MFHLNTRSLGKKANGGVDYCSVVVHDFDVYAFTETWFNSGDDSNLIDLDNYSNIDLYVMAARVVVRHCSFIRNPIEDCSGRSTQVPFWRKWVIDSFEVVIGQKIFWQIFDDLAPSQ